MKAATLALDQIKLCKMIYFFFLLQPFFLGFILVSTVPKKDMDISVLIQNENLILTIVAAFTFIAGFFMQKVILSKKNIKNALDIQWTKEYLESLKNNGNRTYNDETVKELLQSPQKDQNFLKITGLFFTSFLSVCLLFEISSLLGFIIAQKAQNFSLFFPYLIPTYIGLATHFPNADKVFHILEQQR